MTAFYVYRIFDGVETVYVGKGTGRRLKNQRARFRLPGEIIEICNSDDHAFERERYWISTLHPSENRSPGGSGGRSIPKAPIRVPSWVKDIQRVGSRRYVARFLIRKLSAANCERHGVSKLDLDRMIEIASGPWC